ncbi:MAG: acyltransferase family protein [Alphaproteobacteria bacterium]
MNPPVRPYQASKPRLHMLDALRGVCAIMIMVYHYLSWNQIELHQIGTFGVYIFFILSGFSMWYVYADTELSKQSLRAFYVSRFARIFPLYLLVNWKFVSNITSVSHAKIFIYNISFLFGFSDPGALSGVTGGWSIGIEWVFYIAFPLLWACLSGWRTMLVLTLLALGINQLYVASIFPEGDFGSLWVIYTQFPVFIVYFLSGILCADLFQRFYKHQPAGLSSEQQWLARLGIVLCIFIVFFFPSKDIKDYLWGWHFPLIIFLSALAVLLCAIVQDISPRGVKWCKFLGDISFSTYLTHYLVFKHGTRIFEEYLPGTSLWLMLPVFCCITIVVAYLLFRFYEAPARKFLNRVLGGHRVH